MIVAHSCGDIAKYKSGESQTPSCWLMQLKSWQSEYERIQLREYVKMCSESIFKQYLFSIHNINPLSYMFQFKFLE